MCAGRKAALRAHGNEALARGARRTEGCGRLGGAPMGGQPADNVPLCTFLRFGLPVLGESEVNYVWLSLRR